MVGQYQQGHGLDDGYGAGQDARIVAAAALHGGGLAVAGDRLLGGGDGGRGLELEPGVDGLALQREHGEDALVHPGEVLVGHEPVEGLDPEGELAAGQ